MSSSTPNKETLLANAGFIQKTVTTEKQKAQVEKLAVGQVSAVKYQGKLYYVYPTSTKDHIYVGKQKQFDTYKAALNTQMAGQKAATSSDASWQQKSVPQSTSIDAPVWQGETAGPQHVMVQVFDGFGPLGDPDS